LRPERKTEMAGVGCAVQGLGLLFLVFGIVWWPGVLLGLFGLVLGSMLSRKWVCPACKNRLDSGSVKLCPACRADLSA
jgi:hypothetical protein